jgi:hypothetical protein
MAMKPTDQEIVDLYREAGGAEPSAELDRSILMAARAAVAPKPSLSPWWQRWRLQVPVLASLIVAVMVVVLVERRQPEAPAIGAIALNTPPPAAEIARSESLAVDKVTPPVAENRARMAESAPVRRMPAAPVAAPVASAPREMSEPVAVDGSPAPAASAAPMVADAAAPAMAKSEATGGAEARMAARQAAVPAAKAVQPAKEWLDAMQVLIDQGRIVEARTSLEAFERAYPAVVVPEVMRKRLSQ